MTNTSAENREAWDRPPVRPAPCSKPLARIRRQRPLVHCITNPISINDCANAILSVGGRPIMAEHPREAGEITAGADALVLNIGNITDARMESIRLSLDAACERGIPSVFDMVGVGCSSFRLSYVKDLFQDHLPSVLKGNRSEWKVFLGLEDRVDGVDVSEEDAEEAGRLDRFKGGRKKDGGNPAAADAGGLPGDGRCRPAEIFAQKDRFLSDLCTWTREHRLVALVSGETDLVTDGRQSAFIENGTPMLSRLTGTGCMQGVLAGTFLAVEDAFSAAVDGAVLLGEAGERAAKRAAGPGSFHMELFDALSAVDDDSFWKHAKCANSVF